MPARSNNEQPSDRHAKPAAVGAQPRGVVDRRTGLDRREFEAPGASSGFERRRGPGRRLSDFTRSAEEGEMTREQFFFLKAIDAFKQANQKTYPSWTDVLEVVRLLGYRKTCAAEVEVRGGEDWTEPADAPSNVKASHRAPDDVQRDAA